MPATLDAWLWPLVYRVAIINIKGKARALPRPDVVRKLVTGLATLVEQFVTEYLLCELRINIYEQLRIRTANDMATKAEQFPTREEAASMIAQLRLNLKGKVHNKKPCTLAWTSTIWCRMSDNEKLHLAGTEELSHGIGLLIKQAWSTGYFGWRKICGTEDLTNEDSKIAFQIVVGDWLTWIATLTEEQYNNFADPPWKAEYNRLRATGKGSS
jgi:hypothetical protein